jgi:hypothetical protein
MTSPQKQFWFPAKTYGYGWGPPTSWQGWLVMAIFATALAASAIACLPGKHTARFVVCTVLLTLALLLVCWLKGEKPRWRWGKDRS